MIDRDAYAHHFEFVAGPLCLEFCNTINYANGNERLTHYRDLLGWGLLLDVLTDQEAGALLARSQRHPADGQAALEEARALRRTLHGLFSAAAYGRAPGAGDVAALNGALNSALARTRLEPSEDGFRWAWSVEDALDRVLWPVARSAADLLTAAELAWVKRCAGQGCTWLFLDQTRNHSRRWCEMAVCGNRAKARRHYHRARGAG